MAETKINASQTTITAEDIGAAPVYDTMPTAAVGYLDKIVQFVGTTDATYTNGYFYKCVSDGDPTPTYSWVRVDVQPGSSYTAGTGIDITSNAISVINPIIAERDGTKQNPSVTSTTGFAAGYWAVAGKNQYGQGDNTMAVGISANAKGNQAMAIGQESSAGHNAVAVGKGANASVNNVAIGVNAIAGSNGILIGCKSGETITGTANAFDIVLNQTQYTVVGSDGTIPTDRFTTTPSSDGTYVPTLSISSGTATRSWSVPSKMADYTSNSITGIPQDINLELSSGTLTLKSGSKVYVPNGDGVFDTITTAADKTMFDSSVAYGGQVLVCYNSNNNTLVGARVGGTNTIGSGTIADRPAASSMSFGAGLYYATDENILYIGNKSQNTWAAGASLPLAIVSITSGVGCTGIDQVFNGFGYIGSTVFALPGVKGLVPNGRNADGTLKSIEITISNVLTTTDSSGATGGLEYYLSSTSINRANFGTYSYNAESNNIVDASGVRQNTILIDPSAYRDSGKVSSFSPKYAFHAVDYNDTDFIANCAMPSDRYIELTVGTSPFNVTAPADGYIVLAKNATTAGYEIRLKNQSNLLEVHDAAAKNNQDLAVSIPCSKGQVVRVYLSADGTTNSFRFVYANGAK